MRILITGANGPAGRALGAQLASSDFTVIGADMDSTANEYYAVIEKVPAASDPSMIGRLAEIIREHHIDVLIPTVSDELPAVAAAGAELAGCTVMIGSPEAVSTAHDKWLTMQVLAAAGVPVPRSALPSSFENLDVAFEALGRPLIVKPRVARGGRGVGVVGNHSDLDFSALDDSWVLQEFASGEEFAPMVFNGNGENDLAVVVRKTELKQGVVGNAVSTERVAANEAVDVQQIALDAVRAVGLEYQADLDIRRLANGQPVVLEINARFGANSRQAPELLSTVLRASSRALAAVGGRP
ncbi:ATP-grasp domain-containing protein [Glutamicibacter soli]